MGRLFILAIFLYPVFNVEGWNLQNDSYLQETYTLPDTSLSQSQADVFLNQVAFADSVILYDPGALGQGTGDEPDPTYQNPEKALGAPDEDENPHPNFVSLGRGGNLVLEFKDNVLFDGNGPDLSVFFAEGDSEDVKIWISQNGQTFRYIGIATHENPDLDISRVTMHGEFFSYIKIRDDMFQGENEGARLGADIDAVRVIHTAARFVRSTTTLFQNESTLSASASEILKEVIQMIQSLTDPLVLIHAHTDNRGSADLNLIRSQSQADAIHYFLINDMGLTHARYSVMGWGESNPVSSQNQNQNNRVEIFILTQ